MNILTQIVDDKIREVAERRNATPLQLLIQQAAAASPSRGFLDALKRADGVALIAEVKKASPSKGIILDDFNPVSIAKQYAEGGATCLSVLTDEKYFQGSMADMRAVLANVDLPVLRKDFIVDEYQVFESRASGADCILLIVAALDEQRLCEYSALGKQIGLDVLVEVHDERDMALAAKSGAEKIAINNRDLTTFETDLAVTEKLARRAPPNALLVSESAIWSRDDVLRVQSAGVKAILVGESLMKSANIPAAARELLGK